MDLDKPVNWKRVAATNGEYGCLGDLGLHTQHLPLRMGLLPRSVYAGLANLVHSRPDGKGGSAVCDTWDNATLLCEARGPQGEDFPMILTTKRMAPGATNLWSLEIDGLEGSARFSTDDAAAFYYTQKWGREQAWCRVNVGYKPQFKTAIGPIFEFGFADSILQMWAAFMAEMDGRAVALGCATPQEARFSHALNTAALLSHSQRRAVEIEEVSTW